MNKIANTIYNDLIGGIAYHKILKLGEQWEHGQLTDEELQRLAISILDEFYQKADKTDDVEQDGINVSASGVMAQA